MKEIRADVLAIDNLLTTRTAVVKTKTGKDFKDLVAERKGEDDLLRSAGLMPIIPTMTKPAEAVAAAKSAEPVAAKSATTTIKREQTCQK